MKARREFLKVAGVYVGVARAITVAAPPAMAPGGGAAVVLSPAIGR